MFTTFVNTGSQAAATTWGDLPAIADADIGTRNNHMIPWDQLQLLAVAAFGATMTGARYNSPTINAYGRHQFWPLMQSAVIPDNPRFPDYRNQNFLLPTSEEIGIEASNGAAGAEQETVISFLGTTDWNDRIPSGVQRLTLGFTATYTSLAYAFAPLAQIQFNESIRGGWYSIIGMTLFDPNLLLGRLIFSTGNVTQSGRRMKPGVLGQNAIANRPYMPFDAEFGVYGKFRSTELPQLECFCTNAAAHTLTGRLDVVYTGNAA